MNAMLSVEEAQARILALATPLPVERVDIAGSFGRYLAEPLRARRTQPAAHLSAMDGYAVAGDDLAGPWDVIGESAAGHPFAGSVGPGQAVRIATGALMPDGAGSVILQEDVERSAAKITLTGTAPSPHNRHVRHCGADFLTDAELLPAGSKLTPARIALAVSAGHSHLPVRRLPRISVIDSGDELAADPLACAVHQIPASNGIMLTAMLAELPCIVDRLGPVADRIDDLVAALERAGSSDIIVTTGGASVGDHDLIRPALARWGAELDFWRVAMKPGKPLLVARRGAQVVVGLPGNPVSSHVTALLFLMPLVRALAGARDPLPRTLTMKLASDARPGGSRREFLRGRITDAGIEILNRQDSGALASLAVADVIIDRPANGPALECGAEVPAYLLANSRRA